MFIDKFQMCIRDSLYAGAKTGTAVAAGLRTTGRHYRCLCTVINTVVVVKSLNLVTGSFTTYKCNLLLCCSCRYAKDSSDFFAYRCSTYRTCICKMCIRDRLRARKLRRLAAVTVQIVQNQRRKNRR